MSDLIKRQDAIDAFRKATADGDKVDFCVSVINKVPSAQRKGKWIDDGDRDFPCVCSVCGDRHEIKAKFLFSYCPNCGARMVSD